MRNIDECDLHGCATELETVRVEAATRIAMKDSPRYVRERRERFPNSNDVLVARGAWRLHKSARVAVCAKCCAARDAFLKAEYPSWSTTHDLAS